MSTNVNVQNFNIGINGLVSAALGTLGALQFPLALTQLVSAALTNGSAAANKVNQIYISQTTLAASASLDVNLYSYSAGLDPVGNALTMATVKLLIFQNLGVSGAVVEADYIKLGGKGTTAGWTSFFGTNSDTGKILSGGTLVLWEPGATGYVVGTSTTNNILTLTAGANSGACGYNLIVVGATA